MVLRLDPTTKAAAVLSFQRDLWVKIPGRASQRINTTFEKGKYDLMAATLQENFGVKIDHFVQIDFCAFKQIVDAVGGVSVPFTYPVRDANTGLNVTEPGCYAFSGDAALAYVRSRHLQYQDTDGQWKSDGTSDFGRIARQQDFMRRMLQVANAKGLFSPSVVRGLIDAVQKYVVFDETFSIDDMLKFAGLLREIPPTSIHTYQVQSTGTTISGNAVLLPQIEGANMKAILDIFRGTAALAAAPEQVDDTTPSAATSTDASTTTTTAAGSGPVGSGATSTSSSTSTSTTVAGTTPVTNPDDITKGIVPDKNATC
jgi:LCP family protein required for cell wall assembly